MTAFAFVQGHKIINFNVFKRVLRFVVANEVRLQMHKLYCILRFPYDKMGLLNGRSATIPPKRNPIIIIY